MIHTILVAIAPVIIILLYVYYRDKYEKEPISMLLKGLFLGMIIVAPISIVESFLARIGATLPGYWNPFFTAFVVAAFTEELFKFMAVYLLIWRNKAFNEKFDGIVYAVFVSMGFALVENIMYVLSADNGLSIGISRALTAVPAHAMFGILMGFHFGNARFYPENRRKYLRYALLIPIIFHGIYDFILMAGNETLLLLFFPFIIYMLFRVRHRMRLVDFASREEEEKG